MKFHCVAISALIILSLSSSLCLEASASTPLRNLALDFKTDPACSDIATQLLDQLDEYGKFTAFSRVEEAGVALKQIRFQLNSLSRDDCFESVAPIYAVATLALLDPIRYYDSPVDDHFHLSYSPDIIKVGAALVKAGSLKFILPVDRAKFGKSWKDVFGYYDCKTSRIAIDLSMPPFDLGAIFLHELDHLFRDKYLTLSEVKSYFSDELSPNIDWLAFAILDEELAIFQSAFYEDELVYSRGDVPTDFYDNGQDLELIDRAGQISGIRLYIEGFNAMSDVKKFTTHSIRQWLDKLILINNNEFANHWKHATAPWTLLPISSVFGLIKDAYVGPETKLSNIDLHFANPVEGWNGFSSPGFKFDRQGHILNSLDYFSPHFSNENGIITRLGIILDQGLPSENFLEDFSHRLSYESEVCRAYENAIDHHLLDHYLGVKLGKPGGTGVKPGGTGVKPGGTGVKPSIDVHPCVRFPEDSGI